MRDGIENQLGELQQMIASEPDEALRHWYLQEFELTPESRAIRNELNIELARDLGELISSKEARIHQVEQAEIVPEHVETGHSDDSKIIKWATDSLDEFIQLPTIRPVKQKKTDTRDRNFIRRQLDRFSLVDETEPRQLLHQPELLGKALETWAVVAIENNGRSAKFFELVVGELREESRQNWRETTKENMAGIVRQWTHAEFAGQAFEQIVRGHFMGPGNMIDQLKIYLDFCLSAQYVLDDQQAIDQFAEIAYFRTQALPRKGHVHQAIIDAPHRVDNLEISRLGNDIDKISAGLSIIASNDQRAYARDLNDGVNLTDATQYAVNFSKENNISYTDAVKVLRQRNAAVSHFLRLQEAFVPARMFQQLHEKFGTDATSWVYSAAYEASEYREEYLRTFGSRAMTYLMQETYSAQSSVSPDHLGAYKVGDIVSIPLNENMMVDILIPEDAMLTPEELQATLQIIYAESQTDAFQEQTKWIHTEMGAQVSGYSRTIAKGVELGERKLLTAIRTKCDLDKLHEHSLNQLIWNEIPELPTEVLGANETIIERIRLGQRRFVSKRGFKVTFQSKGLAQSGFQSMIFKKDSAHPNTMNVSLNVNGQALRYKLSQHFQLDLEGRRLHSERLKRIVEQRTLAILEDYMTRDALESSEGTISGNETGTTMRIAHLAYLPTGQNFREEAWEHCRDEQGVDLRAASLRRRPMDPEGRNSTYRRATEYDDPNAEPLEIYVNNMSII